MNIAVLVSGGGTNLGALIKAQQAGELGGGKIVCVISSKPGVFALERAKNAGIPGEVLPAEEKEQALLDLLASYKADLVVLAGFMTILGSRVIAAYPNRIINIHPALIPSFCGKGYYGLRVHKAALEYGVKVSGATVHFVNEIPDGGAIILQQAVPVQEGDTPEALQQRIMEQAEWKLLPRAVKLFCEGKITVEDNKTRILED